MPLPEMEVAKLSPGHQLSQIATVLKSYGAQADVMEQPPGASMEQQQDSEIHVELKFFPIRLREKS